MLLELGLGPARRQRRVWCHEVFPLDIVRVEERRDVRFIRLLGHRRKFVLDRARVVLVGQAGEVMAELVHEQVARVTAVGGRRAEQAVYPAAAVDLGVGQDLDEVIRS